MSKAKLAIHGGKPVIDRDKTGKWPIITSEDIASVTHVLRSGIIGGINAPEAVALRKEWASYTGAAHCLTLNSGTAALHIAVAAAGVGPGDEVITSAYSFSASALAVLHHNAIPIFVDIDHSTPNINPKKIEKKISPRTKAIIPVHMEGLPCDMDEINAIARKHKLVVIEDACQAHGALYKGRKAGSLGDMAAFSLNFTKNLTGGEGGLFTTNRDKYLKNAGKVASFGEVIKNNAPRAYRSSCLGWMYRPCEITMALARSQLKRLDEYNYARQKNCEYLSRELAEIKGVIPPIVPADRTHVYHIYRIRLDPKAMGIDMDSRNFRMSVQKALNAEGVFAHEYQSIPLPGHEIYQLKEGYGHGCPWSCPHSRKTEYRSEDYAEVLNMIDNSFVLVSEIAPPNGKELMGKIVEAFRKVFENIAEVLENK
ncbi:MAG: DegT/DnrJ/EryC1/StrS family aminotransferase [Kiritimatiellae bacterium]|nr:DegT/DnrJ/EryC1/StrS family aminotransferase [Kiritimatiellia bacterium]